MRTRKLFATAATTVFLLAVAVAPGNAVCGDSLDPSCTQVTFEVTGDGISIEHAQGTTVATLTGGALTLGGTTVSGALHQMTVTDLRGVPGQAWTITAGTTAGFTNGTDTIGASDAVAYLNFADATAFTTNFVDSGGTLADVTKVATVAIPHPLDGSGDDIATKSTLFGGTTTLGSGTSVFTPHLEVTVPAGSSAGTYTGEVTQTVS